MPRAWPATSAGALASAGLDDLTPVPAEPGETGIPAEVARSGAAGPYRLGEPGAPPLPDLALACRRLVTGGPLSVRAADEYLYEGGHREAARKVLRHLRAAGLATAGPGGSTEATADGKAADTALDGELARIGAAIDAKLDAELAEIEAGQQARAEAEQRAAAEQARAEAQAQARREQAAAEQDRQAAAEQARADADADAARLADAARAERDAKRKAGQAKLARRRARRRAVRRWRRAHRRPRAGPRWWTFAVTLGGLVALGRWLAAQAPGGRGGTAGPLIVGAFVAVAVIAVRSVTPAIRRTGRPRRPAPPLPLPGRYPPATPPGRWAPGPNAGWARTAPDPDPPGWAGYPDPPGGYPDPPGGYPPPGFPARAGGRYPSIPGRTEEISAGRPYRRFSRAYVRKPRDRQVQ